MSRFVPYLGIIVALALFAFISSFAGEALVWPTPVRDTSSASSTLSVLPGLILPPLTLPSLTPKTDDVAVVEEETAPAPKKVAPSEPAPTPVPAASEPVPVAAPVPVLPPPTLPSSGGNAALDISASALRAALVNIICYVPLGSALHSISGSGVFIDSKGIILTNAHVAQYFLLANKGASCTIRTGSPAADSYKAALIYLPAAWVNANADILTTIEPNGTGEYDFAFLAVTKSVTRNALPALFPFVPLASSPPGTGTPVVIASYGAQFLESNQIQSSLSPTIVFGSVKDIFTFRTNTVDVIALGGSAAAQEGSSGGGVADAAGELVGTITTSTTKGATDTRSLDAITASYIRSAYASETGSALDLLLSLPLTAAIAAFAPQIPPLAAILTAGLP